MCVGSQSGFPTHLQYHLGEVQIPGPPLVPCFTTPSVQGGGFLSSAEGVIHHPYTDLCTPPLPGELSGGGERSAGRDSCGNPRREGPSASWRRGAGAPQSFQKLADKGRKCPLQGGTGTAKDEFRLRSRRRRRGQNSCKEMELLSSEKADRPAYVSVSKASSALQRDLHAQCWGLGSGEVLDGLSKGSGQGPVQQSPCLLRLGFLCPLPSCRFAIKLAFSLHQHHTANQPLPSHSRVMGAL